MGVIFDTSGIITLERDGRSLDGIIRERGEEPFGISVITVAELLHGVERADSDKTRIRRQAFAEKVIEMFPVFPFDTAAARIYSRLWATQLKKGLPVGAHDLMIAATAICHDYAVVTSNLRDFEKIEGLTVVKFNAPPR
jgi:tRNA(fMet)-specific endonuclease VapC